MLRIRTGYSFRAAVGMLPEIAGRMEELNYEYFPITDRASTFGFNRWANLCRDRGLAPIFGVELGVAEDYSAKKPIVDYWTFIAIEELETLFRLVALATSQFRYEPLLSYEQAQSFGDGKIIRIMGHRVRADLISPRDDLFMGIGPGVYRGHLNAILGKGIPPVAIGNNVYPRPVDIGRYEVICGRNASTQSYPQSILSEKEWSDYISGIIPGWDQSEALKNKSEIEKRCSGVEIKKGNLPKVKKKRSLRSLCESGAERLGINLSDPIYKERLKRELDLIHEKDFEDYFYIVSDICLWARERMQVGPARGSSAGSLVCYLLGITTIDPIPFGLIFERFIDLNRDDLPDIDIDFSDQRRKLVFDYVDSQYGIDHCARLGTVALYRPRSALHEAGAALKVPPWKIDKLQDSIIQRSSGDARALNTLEDTLSETPIGKEIIREFPRIRIAQAMEGHPRHYSQHAAGVVITERPILEHVAIDQRTGATMCDKKDAEDLNLLKIDCLGLTQLSIFEDALEIAKLPRDHLGTIPLDDKKAFAVLNQGHFSGIFQYEGLALQSLLGQFEVDCFDDIAIVSALGRPGPLVGGGAHKWVHRKAGLEPVQYPHPLFEPYLKETLGVIVYQEQVMEIGRGIGELDWKLIAELRKAMSRTLGIEYFNKFGDPWKAKAVEKGMPPEIASEVWDELCAYGAWSFNKSHAIAYGLISYYCCWLKAHHPYAFAAATLTHQDKPEKQIQLLREMKKEGIDYVPICAERSTDKWTVGKSSGRYTLIGPITSVTGIGPKTVQEILGARSRGEPLPARASKLLKSPRTSIDSLWPIRDGIHRSVPDLRERNIHTEPVNIGDISRSHNDRSLLCLGTFVHIQPRDENEDILIAKRNGKRIDEPNTSFLNLRLQDDTGIIFCKVNRWDFPKIGQQVIDKGRPGKNLWAVKGVVWIPEGGDFKMIKIKQLRYLGDLADDQ